MLDSIRQCEGVAQLLQNSAVKEVPVKPVKSNKISPEGIFYKFFFNLQVWLTSKYKFAKNDEKSIKFFFKVNVKRFKGF